MSTEDWPVRAITDDEYAAYTEALARAFGNDLRPGETERYRPTTELDRTSVVFDGTTLIGTAAIDSFDMTMSGPTRPVAEVAGVTAVSVQPTHRRRGVLGALMRDQLVGLHEGTNGRGEAIAALYASEAPIYGRFGYGLASWGGQVTLSRRLAALRQGVVTDHSTMQLLATDKARPHLESVYDVVRRHRPGHFARTSARWDLLLADPEQWRQGASSLTAVVANGDSGATGYVLYRTTSKWVDGDADGTLEVVELGATTPGVYADLWRYLLGMDLMSTISAHHRPLDEPLLLLLSDNRTAKLRVSDGLWIRLVDVERALGQRGYATEVDVVLDVTDVPCPWNAGRWRVSTGPDGASCARTEDAADLSLDARTLGSIFLGGVALGSLAAAGEVTEHRPGALAATTAAFLGDVAPFCAEIF